MECADLARRLTRRSVLTASALGALAGVPLGKAGAQEVLPTVSPAASPAATPVAGDGAHDPVFLFVQLADAGTWMPSGEADDVFLLSLTGISGQTVYFSDRPDRIVGTMETSGFLESLGFTPINPPNAAAVVRTPEGERDVLVVELFDPVYTENISNPGADTLVYKARVLDAYHDGNLQSWYEEENDPMLPERFADVSLLIDDCADLVWCYRNGATIFDPKTPIGPLPNGPVGMCFTWTFQGCLPCNKTSIYHWWDICNQTYSDCQYNCEAL
jgi:hypothetical protein